MLRKNSVFVALWRWAAFCLASAGMLSSMATLRVQGANASLKPFAGGFTSPVALVPMNDDNGNVLVADQVGLVFLVTKSGVVRGQPFLGLSHRTTKLNMGFDERGLLGLALHPKFSENRKLYVYYSAPLRAGAPLDWDHTSRISEFKVRKDDPERVDIDSERVILEFDEPYFNHNSGSLAFGPDGDLYIAVGDGGNRNDIGRGHSEMGNGQDLSRLLGKILRIDIDHGEPYSIPSDNPFQGDHMRAEIYAFGLRNPWRMTFDRGGRHDLIAGDIGQTLYEEVDVIRKGGNYGWHVREGTHCFDPTNERVSPSDCPDKDRDGRPFIDPVLEYKNANGFRNDPDALGISITGGYIYRGAAIPELQGKYVFADWTKNWALPAGRLYVATPREGKMWTVEELHLEKPKQLTAYVIAFGEDAEGELYVLTNGLNGLSQRKGTVYKLVAP